MLVGFLIDGRNLSVSFGCSCEHFLLFNTY